MKTASCIYLNHWDCGEQPEHYEKNFGIFLNFRDILKNFRSNTNRFTTRWIPKMLGHAWEHRAEWLLAWKLLNRRIKFRKLAKTKHLSSPRNLICGHTRLSSPFAWWKVFPSMFVAEFLYLREFLSLSSSPPSPNELIYTNLQNDGLFW